jgi:hypothetical protein
VLVQLNRRGRHGANQLVNAIALADAVALVDLDALELRLADVLLMDSVAGSERTRRHGQS